MEFTFTYFLLEVSRQGSQPIAREFRTKAANYEAARSELHRKLNEWNYQAAFAPLGAPRWLHWTEDL